MGGEWSGTCICAFPSERVVRSTGFGDTLLRFRFCSATWAGYFMSLPQFLHLLNENKINSIYLIGLLQELTCAKTHKRLRTVPE